ncbi:ubiquitin carboxyl-terminal hydrolase 40-like [Lineus longissimus]|uniref:ubiquitin carboxyl-terminal hydrolase 40-like n=1 Tax=Lineus longissimus TaxID=88925 RepID=UPI00315CC86F
MFSMLFDEDSSDVAATGCSNRPTNDAPPPSRPSHRFCGILNQGATCYLNSLLQTLFLTPEFRDALFALGTNELGRIEDKNKAGSKVRIIPIELQRLFVRMLHLNQSCTSTTDLTDSFGWTNNEELQQHDVQELNRILFIAIEESLVGTSGQNLIKNLYHGSVVNQIICQECGRVSENEEHFLDLTITVAGNIGLENGLYNQYVETERLDGKNQYRCGACNKLVDAKKGARIRRLPPILSFSLLRFSFDFIKLERYKENGKFTFPLSLDMSRYVEQESPDNMEYELFSVVIHSGSAYGGHYHAYIRDVEGSGEWVPPDEEVITLSKKKEDDIDLVQLDSPRNVLKALLENAENKSLSVDVLAQELMKQTGVSWNKRFKKHNGTISKFVQKHDDIFMFSESTRTVSLKSDLETFGTKDSTPDGSSGTKQDPWIVTRHNSSKKDPPPPGHCWFDFNDTHVHPIWQSDIEKQFSGRESGYMLFYRKRSYQPIVHKTPIPPYLKTEVDELNAQLLKQREDHESEQNCIVLTVLQAADYEYSSVTSALRSCKQSEPKQITLDRRKNTMELRHALVEIVGDTFSTVHTAKHLPAGLHLYNKVICDLSNSVKDAGLKNNDLLFLWDGEKIRNGVVAVGTECEPVLLTVHEGSRAKLERGFPKNLPLGAMRISLMEVFDLKKFDIHLLTKNGNSLESVLLSRDQDQLTLEEFKLGDGSEILISKSQSPSEMADVQEKLRNDMTLSVAVKCLEEVKGEYPTVKVNATSDTSVEELKALVISKLPQDCDIPGGGRFRIDDQNVGLQIPLRENLTLEKAAIHETTHLIFEGGSSPTTDEVTLNIRLAQEGMGDVADFEVILNKNSTILECLTVAASKLGLAAGDWHLRQANWCGEAAAILDDIDKTLEQCNVRDGTLLLLEEGRLPPKGFYQLPVWLYPTPACQQDSVGYISWITSGFRGLISGGKETSSDAPTNCGMIEVARESSVAGLKSLILTLPAVAERNVPMIEFLRVRLIENGRLKNVLRDNKQNIQRQKVSASSNLCVQVLEHEEMLGNNDVLLQIWERMPQSRSYSSRGDIVWDSSKDATVTSLKQRCADHLTLPMEQIAIAKHFEEKYEWMVIRDVPHSGKQQRGNKGKKKDGGKVNVKHAPYLIKDGDVIGVKNLAYDPTNEDDFTTVEDDEGKEKLKQLTEQKQKERQQKKSQFASGMGPNVKKKERKEVGLSIKVGDFR